MPFRLPHKNGLSVGTMTIRQAVFLGVCYYCFACQPFLLPKRLWTPPPRDTESAIKLGVGSLL